MIGDQLADLPQVAFLHLYININLYINFNIYTKTDLGLINAQNGLISNI